MKCCVTTQNCPATATFTISWRTPGGWHLCVCDDHLVDGVKFAIGVGRATDVRVSEGTRINDPGPVL